jgi:hypothetical protein
MALVPATGMIAGAFYVQVAKRNSSGYPVGTVADPETIAADTTSSSLLIGSLDSFTPPTPTTEFAIDQGGQSLRGSIALGNSATGTPAIVLSEFDETLHALIKGTAADATSVDGWLFSAGNVQQKIFPQLTTLVTTKILNIDDGSEYFHTWVMYNTQWQDAGGGGASQASGTNPNPLSYNLNLSMSQRNVTGVALSESSGMQVVDGTDAWCKIRSRWPIALTTYIADGIETDFILGYRPVFSTVTDGKTDNSFTINGVATAPTSVDTSTGVVVIAAAGSAQDVHVAAYQTKFVAI